MKLREFLPSLGERINPLEKLSNIANQHDLITKAIRERVASPNLGVEQLYFDWLRSAYAYRRMMIQDLFLVAMDITEVRTATTHIKNEVFRKGLGDWEPKFLTKCVNCGKEFKSKVEYCDECFEKNDEERVVLRRIKDKETGKLELKSVTEKRKVFARDERGKKIPSPIREPDISQTERFDEMQDDCNKFGQSMEEVFRMMEDDFNIVDDAFLWVSKAYIIKDNGDVLERVEEIRRINPAVIEFDLDKNGLPKNNHWICLNHREIPCVEPGECLECGLKLYPVMYIWNHRGKKIYLLDNEVIHNSKFSPSELYGYSPLLTILQKVLTISGMDRFLYRYFFERKAPAGIILTYTDDPKSLEIEKSRVEARLMQDPTYLPWVAVSQRQGSRGRTDFVRLFHTLQEMDYLPVRNEIRDRISAIYGVSAIWMGAPESFGGISTQTQQLVVTSRTVEGDQRLFNEKIIKRLIDDFGVTDWTIKLEKPEEKVESVILQQVQQKVTVAQQMKMMGFKVSLKPEAKDLDTLEFEFEELSPEEQQQQMMGMMGG